LLGFTAAARTETQIASASHRPTSASSAGTASIHSLSEAIPKLLEASKGGKTSPEETYIARVCIAEINWLQENGSGVLEALPEGNAPSTGSKTAPLGWLEVCEVKARFLRVAALESIGREDDLEDLYRTAVSHTPGSRTPELRKWTERLLARACMYNAKKVEPPTLPKINDALLAFRAWASFWQRSPPPTSGGSNQSRIDIPRRQVWKAYYDLLSIILQSGLVYSHSTTGGSAQAVPPKEISPQRIAEVRVQQRAELKRVEATYESLLLNETQFPKASQTNTEVEEWVEAAVENWRIFCGPAWTDADLGEGGKEAVGRSMLDILYRAATKTFHSTAILRQLFTVHAALGEFDLAMHAFDSYVEIVGKGKAREEKTGKHEIGFDSEDVAILTAAEALQMLIKFGDREQNEKAMHIVDTLRHWLGEHLPTNTEDAEKSDDNKIPEQPRSQYPTQTQLQPSTVAAAYRAIGVSQAHWGGLTYDADTRTTLRNDALRNLQTALNYDESSVQTAYAFARVLAEARDLSSAVKVLQRQLALQQSRERESEAMDGFERQKQMVSVWHLLSICMTAKDEFDPAMQMCAAALEQFGDSNVLFGRNPATSLGGQHKAMVDAMDELEKETLLQVKMSQLAFMELTEGPEKTVDHAKELLMLFSRLFGNPQQLKNPAHPPPATPAPPPSRGGTLRSVVGTIRPKSSRRRSLDKDLFQPSPASAPVVVRTSASSDPQPGNVNVQGMGGPIAITVTNEDGVSADKEKGHHDHHHHLHMPFKTRSHHGDSNKSSDLTGKKSKEGLNEKSRSENEKPLPVPPPKDTDGVDEKQDAPNPSVVAPAVQHSASAENPTNPQQPLKEIEHNGPHNQWPPPPGHEDQPPEQDVRLPAPHPASDSLPTPSFGSLLKRQHKVSVLVNVLLSIAGLYARAELYDDAVGAIAEARVLIEAFEIDKGAHHANARRLFEKGWGAGKSVDELWADYYAAVCIGIPPDNCQAWEECANLQQKGELATARDQPFEAMDYFEEALLHFPDHPQAIIGISNYLMDIYEEKMPAEKPVPPLPNTSGTLINDPTVVAGSRPATAKSNLANPGRTGASWEGKDPTPAELNRLAARDRAYMLLANLTKLGSGWESSEAWFTLARAHELSGQVGKAKKALWWVVELEDNKPMRPFGVTSAGGYAL
jgi:cargo-transport protein YPP1